MSTQDPGPSGPPRAAFNAGAFLLVLAFVWLVFDNLALGLIFGLMAAGGSEVAQRAATRRPD